MGFRQSLSVLSDAVSDALKSAAAKALIVGFVFFPASGAALPNGHAIKREDSKGSLNSEGVTSSPDQSENVTYLGLERMVFTAPVCGLC